MSLNLLSIADFSEKMVKTLDNTLGIWYLVMLYAFGVMAMICKLFEYQVKGRNKMLVVAICANMCWVLHFAFYGDLISSLTCGICVLRLILFAQREKYAWAKSNLWLYFFLALQTVMGIFTFKTWFDIFVLLAGYVAIFTYYVINQRVYRILSIAYMGLWLINDSIKFFPISLINDIICLVSIAVAIIRYDVLKKQSITVKKIVESELNSSEQSTQKDCE